LGISGYETKKLATGISLLDVDMAAHKKRRNVTTEEVCDIVFAIWNLQ
jgi:hypothetical protein